MPYTTTYNVPFRIHRADGSRSPTLINAFVTRKKLTDSELQDGSILLKDGTEWQLIIEDDAIYQAVREKQEVLCIISFQAHTHGNYAVAKLYAPRFKHQETGEYND